MKKQLIHIFAFLLICSASIYAASCNGANKSGNNTESPDSANTEQTPDSKPVDDITWEKDSLAKARMTSPDLTYYELHGPVKYMMKNNTIYYFTPDGVLESYDGYNPFEGDCYESGSYNPRVSLTRDDEGYIVEESGWEWMTEIKWKDGRKVSENMQAEADVYEYTYSYDDNNDLKSTSGRTYICGNEDDITQFVNSYTYGKRDAYDNWLERTMTDNDGISDSEKRTIVYYPIIRPGTKVQTPAFSPETTTYEFTATIGGEKNCEVILGTNGYYKLTSGKRILKLALYNPADGTLCLYAYFKDNTLPIGIFSGKIADGIYKGIFTNLKNDSKLDFKMEQK